MQTVKTFKDYSLTTFDSLAEFSRYILETPFNSAFSGEIKASIDGSKKFTGTRSFDEALRLFREGWSVKAEELTLKFRSAEKAMQGTTVSRRVNDVAGGCVSVPRFLQGQPKCMVRTKKRVEKMPVINIYKSIAYTAATTTAQIIEHSVRALQIVRRLESIGYRVNLYVVDSAYAGNCRFIVAIKIKDASEKINISKCAFPLAHPSMLRRLSFRFVEVSPTTNDGIMVGSYGRVPQKEVLQNALCSGSGSYYIPSFVDVDVSKIKSIEDIAKYGYNRN